VFSPACLEQIQRIDPQPRPAAVYEAERQARITALRMVDGVTVSTEPLAAIVRQYTDVPVAVVPNAIDWAGFRRVCQSAPRPTDAVTIGWVGGTRAEADLVPLAEAWGRMAARFPAVEFIMVGHPSPLLRDAVPRERLHIGGWQPIEHYPAMYQGIDIGCCPLADTPFNRAKSAQKAYEYAAAGAAVVASPTVYGDVLRDGRDGFLAETADAWEHALTLLLDADYRAVVAQRWATRVQQRHSLAATLGQWPSAWETLVTAWRKRQEAA
jgi:glycosyltransferase involved in cell wall biosynthesis